MTKLQTASEQITEEVTSWPEVEAGPGKRGEFAFRLGRREIGHLHGDRVLHTGFPKEVWKELFAQGRIDYHPVFPGKPGYAARNRDRGRRPRRDRAAAAQLRARRRAPRPSVVGRLVSRDVGVRPPGPGGRWQPPLRSPPR